MDRARIYAVIGREKKTIYATHKTELQATIIAERLKKEKIDDNAVVFCNGASQLTHKRFDKWAWLVDKYNSYHEKK